LLRSRHHSTPDHDTTEQAIDSPEHSQYDEAPEEAYGRLREPETDPEDEGSYNAAHKQPALEHRQKDADGPHYRLYAPEHHSSYPEHHSLYSEYDSHHPEYDSQDSEYEDAFEVGGLAGEGATQRAKCMFKPRLNSAQSTAAAAARCTVAVQGCVLNCCLLLPAPLAAVVLS
jgi:hypothetical protein